MPRNRARKSQAPAVGLINLPLPPDHLDREQKVRARKIALHDLVGSILVGPPMFPIKRSTGEALFGLAIEQLAHHDKTMAEALRRYASQQARMEALDWNTSTMGLPPGDATVARISWMLDETPTHSIDDLLNGFARYSRAVGKKTCHPRTLRRQDELLRAYGRTHNYPTGTLAKRVRRSAWAQGHLRSMIAEAHVVSCWHLQPDLSKQDLNKILDGVDQRTSLSSLSALVLAQLHSTTADFVSKRLLPRRR